MSNYDNRNSNDNGNDNDIDVDSEIYEQAKQQYIKEEFIEHVVKFVKIDDLMKLENSEHREKINTLKEQKQELEKTILRYLDSINEDIVNIAGNGKLKKYESVQRSSINKDIIKQSIFEQLKKEKLVNDDEKGKELAELTYNLMESKRERKVKTCLKRTVTKTKKNANQKN